MNINASSSSKQLAMITIILFLALTNLQTSLCGHSKEYQACSQPFKCGSLTDLSYPFYSEDRPKYCGRPGFELLRCNETDNGPTLKIKSQDFRVIYISSSNSTITVVRDDFFHGFGCPSAAILANITIDFSLFQYTPDNANITVLYDSCASVCSSGLLHNMTYPCPMIPRTKTANFCFLTEKMMADHNISKGTCPKQLFLPIHKSDEKIVDKTTILFSASNAVRDGFELKWSADNDKCQRCLASGGQCGHDWYQSNKFFCFCAHESKCPFPGSTAVTWTKSKIAMLVSFSALGAGILSFVTAWFLKRRSSSQNYVLDTRTGKLLDIEAFLRTYGFPDPRRYSYADLKKITDSFNHKLGEGGYGSVYKGKLHSGHLVAVKILKKLKTDADEFINEVVSIGRTNHINVVNLLGFCYHGQKRALVYDFMPNGSLEKFIYGGNDDQNSLSWDKLFEIAVGIARGLEYLHRGCNTRILHFDIKPHNILLDENFCPKISDFGLAKLCPQKDGIISMSEARGTVGYIAPEVFLKSFGGVSHKSDVYSYGMLVLEMVGCRKKAIAGGDSGEEYFTRWIYRQLESEDEEINSSDEMLSDEERELQRKMIMVSLWCVQTNPSSRPAMSRVVELLEGNIELLQMPPRPCSFSSKSFCETSENNLDDSDLRSGSMKIRPKS